MKKEVVFLIFLFTVPLVNAQQEITIFGTNYSIILVAPLFFMAFIALFFLGLIIKDNLPKILHFKFPRIGLKKIKVKDKEHKHEVNLEQEREIDFHSKLNSLKIKLHKLGEETGFDEFGSLFKEFIKTRFNVKQEFTFPEISNLVKDKKIINIAEKISKLKYGDVKINYQDINELLNNFGSILTHYKIKPEPIKLNTFEKLKFNIAKLFKKKVEVKPIKIKAKLELPEAPIKPAKPISIKEEKPSPLFLLRKLNYKLFASLRKRHILDLIKHGKRVLIKNPNMAKRLYARALLNYYKLPLKFEKNIANELIGFHDEILKYRAHEKAFLDVSRSLLKLKHRGEHVSEKGVNLVNIMKDFIKKEELLAATRLKEFSHKLKNEERKLSHFVHKESDLVEEKEHEVVKDLRHLYKKLKPKHKIEIPIEIPIKAEVKPGAEIKYVETKKPEVKFEHFDRERFKFLLKQPRVYKEKHEIIKPVKRLSKNLKLLQKEKSHLYSKLVDLETKITPAHKLEHKFKAQ